MTTTQRIEVLASEIISGPFTGVSPAGVPTRRSTRIVSGCRVIATRDIDGNETWSVTTPTGNIMTTDNAIMAAELVTA